MSHYLNAEYAAAVLIAVPALQTASLAVLFHDQIPRPSRRLMGAAALAVLSLGIIRHAEFKSDQYANERCQRKTHVSSAEMIDGGCYQKLNTNVARVKDKGPMVPGQIQIGDALYTTQKQGEITYLARPDGKLGMVISYDNKTATWLDFPRESKYKIAFEPAK